MGAPICRWVQNWVRSTILCTTTAGCLWAASSESLCLGRKWPVLRVSALPISVATTGIFDGRVAATVAYFDNSEAVNAPVARTATIYLNSLRFTGTKFQLRPGDAHAAVLLKSHSPTVYLPDVP